MTLGRCRGNAGSASIWVLACAALLATISYAVVLRNAAVLARHRVEAAADLAAVAGAGQIGLGDAICAAVRRNAAENAATVTSCHTALGADGRSGTVTVRLAVTVRLPVVGAQQVRASARAERAACGTMCAPVGAFDPGPGP